MSHICGDTGEVLELSNAKNVSYILRGTRLLILLINLGAAGSGALIARARNVQIEDLPVQLDLRVSLPLRLSGEMAAAAKLNTLADAGKNTKWAVEGALLRLVIDLSAGPEISRSNASGSHALLASIYPGKKIGTSNYTVEMELRCRAGGKWAVVLSPRSVAKSSRDVSLSSAVVRELEYSPSVSPPRGRNSAMDNPGLIELNECITLDVRELPIAKLRLNLNGKEGLFVRFTGSILSGIGISLAVQCSSGSISPFDARHGAGKMLNIEAYEERGCVDEGILVIEFDSTKEYGEHHKGRCMISNANHLVINNRYALDFTASGPVKTLPSFTEVYSCVRRFLDPMHNPLSTLSMPDVRVSVIKDFPHLAQSWELKRLVWEAVRLYVIMDYLPHERQEASMSPVFTQPAQ